MAVQSTEDKRRNLWIFLGYCSIGCVGAGYLASSTFKQSFNSKINLQQNDKLAKKTFLTPTFNRVIYCVAFTIFYFVGMGFLIKKLKPYEIFFEQAQVAADKRLKMIKLDLLLQKSEIFQPLQYFRVSQHLVEKVKDQLNVITKAMKDKGETIDGEEFKTEKELTKFIYSKAQME